MKKKLLVHKNQRNTEKIPGSGGGLKQLAVASKMDGGGPNGDGGLENGSCGSK